jgi:glutamate-ammonia-ligase adenylyltransferase
MNVELPTEWHNDFHSMLEQFQASLTLSDAVDASGKIWFIEQLSDSVFIYQLAQVWLGSQFAFDWCKRQPDWLISLLRAGTIDHAPDVTILQSLAEQANDEASLMQVLRRFRQRAMLHIIWRDITRRATTLQTTAALTALADMCIQQAVDFLYPRLCAEFGTPCNDSGVPQSFLVIGMGKLGAFELNLSSDIDLIFAYDESGETIFADTRSATLPPSQHNGNRRSILNRDFFTRLGQKLILVIDKLTADGFVFRVDMRLRPYGDSGALALNYDAMEQYYQQQGRDWERYAMIKARLIYGDSQQAAPLMDMLRRFTYRRYLDFSAIDALRDLKRQIEREMAKRGMNDNIKLGKGGIREIEFIVQSFQLIHGGRDSDLQPAPVIAMLSMLESKDLLSADDVAKLQSAYFFLRNVEHLLQAWRDEQTQMLPHDPIQQARTAWLMGYNNWLEFSDALQVHRDAVQQIFSAVITSQSDNVTETQHGQWQQLWEGSGETAIDTETDIIQLQASGFSCAEQLQPLLQAWRSDKSLSHLHSDGRDRLNRFMPLLLQELAHYTQADIIFSRLLPLLRAVLRRSAYLVLLIENQQALKQLVLLVDASSWIAEQLALAPVLLDELLDPRHLYRDLAPSREELTDLLRQQMLRIPEDDLEMQLETLRHFKRSHSLRAAACEVTQRLPLMKVSDYLTFMAEVILDYVLHMAWKPLANKHGTPQLEDGTVCNPGFIIVGYGKLGGLELSHGSDLDLVFIHNAGSGETLADTSTGQTPIENSTFFARLGQKIIHILNTRTVNGILYEVDMRLRPSGNSGLLVASLNGFERYEANNAWTWEHQALVRARVVAGCPQLTQQFETVRAHIIGRERTFDALKHDVVDMRNKMRTLDKSSTTHFDLKYGHGGIVDLEFLVQFAVLAWGHAHPALLTWTDNIRILEQLAISGLMPLEQTEQLKEAYRALRSRGHRRVLLGEPTLLEADALLLERAIITAAWNSVLG